MSLVPTLSRPTVGSIHREWFSNPRNDLAVLDTIVAKFTRHGTQAEIIGLNRHSTEIHDRLSGHLSSSH